MLAETGIDLEKAISASIKSRNIHEKGTAYFLRAMRLQKAGTPLQKIAGLMQKSIRWIEESGDVMLLARARFALARVHLAMGDENQAKDGVQQASDVLTPINEALIPDDLAGLLKETPGPLDLLESIMQLGNEIVGIRDRRELVQRVISTINRITGAERGGLFTIEGDPTEPILELESATILTIEDVEHESFIPAIAIHRKAVSTGAS